MAAGHSLGELGALTAAGVLDTDDALELVVLRGRLMAEADDSGSMLALLGGTIEDAEAIAQAAGVTVANDNAPGQVVLSGERGALEEAEEAAREYNVRARPLDVAGAFHSPRMEPAVAPFREALDEVEIGRPPLPRLLRRHRRAVHRRPRRAGRGAHPPGPLARDLPRPARSGRRGLRRDRPRHRAVEAWPAASPRRPPMRSAPLAEAARRDGATLPHRFGARPRPPPARAGRQQPADRRAPRHRRSLDREAHGHPLAPPRDAARAAHRPRHRGRQGRASRTRGSTRPSSTSCSSPPPRPTRSRPTRRPTSPPRSAPRKANAMDIGAACTAFVTALSVGASMIESGRAETVLVIGADALSRFTDFDDKRTAALFGDGAGAIVLGNQDGGGVGPFVFGNDAELAEAIIARRDDPVLRMDGHTTFNSATAALVNSTRDAVELAGLDARRRRPVRLPPGQRPHHEGGRRAARAPDGARRRLHRRHRQHVRRLDPAGARVRARRGPAAPRRHRAGGRRRRRLHVGRRASWSGEAPHEPEAPT